MKGPATSASAQHTAPARKQGGFPPALCNVLGTLLILASVAFTLPSALAQIMGYQVFSVTSDVMAPAIPQGSAAYVKQVDPVDVQVDETIAFRDGAAVVVRRVVENRTSESTYVTKGDALADVDANPVPYGSLVGQVALSVPVVGATLTLFRSFAGKACLAAALVAGIVLNVVADRLRSAHRQAAAEPSTSASGGKRRRGNWIVYALMSVLALVFAGSAGVVLYVNHQHDVSSQTYTSASELFSLAAEPAEGADPASFSIGSKAPKKVDFAALTAANPDIVGWIYCPGTVIDYPVLRGETNDTYLRHDYTGEYNINGSIFVDSGNRGTFEDANTIVYGHHMSTGDMFACLDQWQDQQFYEEHPVMWLLTPKQNYLVVLVSGYHADGLSETYDTIAEPGEQFDKYLAEIREKSLIEPTEGVEINPKAHYVMLSTCAYIFENARFTLHGMLVPVG